MSEVKKETKTKKSPAKKTTSTTKASKITEKKVKEEAPKVKVSKVKEEEALLNKKDQANYHSICKVVQVLAKIGKICLMIFVPFIFLIMILTPICFKDFEITANIIRFGDVNIIVNDDKLSIKYGEETRVIKANAVELDKITTFLSENSKGAVITYIELSLLLFAIVLIIEIYLLYNLEKLFTNLATKKTPFIKENSTYIFRIALFMCALKFINLCLGIVDLSPMRISAYSIMELLIVFALYFIFKYATSMQEKSNTKMSE